MCGQCGRMTRVANNTNTLEMIIHFLVILAPNDDDNLFASLETQKQIPIISEVSEMIAKKRGEIHE